MHLNGMEKHNSDSVTNLIECKCGTSIRQV